MTTKPWPRRLLRLLGTALVLAGVAGLAVAGYQLVWTSRSTGEAQHALQRELTPELARDRSGAARPTAPDVGDPVALIRIPRLGTDWRFVVVEGAAKDQLAKGPGHIPGTALPGQVGNVGIAGHRVTHAHPFYDLDQLRPGDRVVLRTTDGRFTYTVTGSRVVAPTEVSVLDARPGQRLLTLTTCHPRYSARQRLVVQATLASHS